MRSVRPIARKRLTGEKSPAGLKPRGAPNSRQCASTTRQCLSLRTTAQYTKSDARFDNATQKRSEIRERVGGRQRDVTRATWGTCLALGLAQRGRSQAAEGDSGVF